MLAYLTGLGAWAWFVLAVVLLGTEIIAPGTFILWLGLAAIAVGILSLAFEPGWQVQLLAFAGFSIAAVLIWRRIAVRRGDSATDQPLLNRRADRQIGREFVLEEPIVNGSGRVRVDDTTWRVTGPDSPAGATVRVTRADGAVLVVERAG